MTVTAGAAGCAQAALRVEQEHASRDDLLASLQALTNLHTISELHAHRHRPRLKPIASCYEDMLLHAGVDDGITW
ncbi:MAG TPA: hypothetical protein VFS23_03390, partial [Vicinamibacterales bacterium]|nr:hypothetical protein [Vicinamibacterales bacterium]